MANRLQRQLARLRILPLPLVGKALSVIMGRMVPFVGTAGLVIEEMSEGRVVVRLNNRRRVHNHIRGLHAAAMTLAAETASGFVVGMSLPDDKLPLMKSLSVRFKHRCQGGLRVEATLSAEQRQAMQDEPKGEVAVQVVALDASGEQPIQCEMLWAWIPRERANK